MLAMRTHEILALALAPFVYGACARSEAQPAPQPASSQAPAIHVTTAPVAQQPMPEYVTLTGTLRASEESDIAADAVGKVLSTSIERGQTVKKGQVIAVLDARGAALSASAAEAQAKLAQTQLEQAKKDCERTKHLFDTGAISAAEYERQMSQCQTSQWSVAAAQAMQANASKLVGDSRIRAPFDGVIGERFVNVGQYVQPQTRVASIYKPDPLRLELTVPEAQVGAVKQDMSVSFTVAAFGDQTFSGNVKFISPNVRAASRDLVVEAIVPNADRKLYPGMFGIAKLLVGNRPMPVVPDAALKRDETATRVFVVGADKTVQERIVQLGEKQGDVVGILSGVQAGEQVVTSPGADVRDGARVE